MLVILVCLWGFFDKLRLYGSFLWLGLFLLIGDLFRFLLGGGINLSRSFADELFGFVLGLWGRKIMRLLALRGRVMNFINPLLDGESPGVGEGGGMIDTIIEVLGMA